MKKIFFYLQIVFLLTLMLGCLKIPKEKDDDLIRIDSVIINKDVLNIIDTFFQKHSNYKSCLIFRAPTRYCDFESYNYYLIGPAYSYLLNNPEPFINFPYNNKRIFIKSDVDNLFSINNQYNENCNVGESTVGDSVIDNGVIHRGPINLFYCRSIAFVVPKKNNNKKIFILSFKPDTIYFPKVVKDKL